MHIESSFYRSVAELLPVLSPSSVPHFVVWLEWQLITRLVNLQVSLISAGAAISTGILAHEIGDAAKLSTLGPSLSIGVGSFFHKKASFG